MSRWARHMSGAENPSFSIPEDSNNKAVGFPPALPEPVEGRGNAEQAKPLPPSMNNED